MQADDVRDRFDSSDESMGQSYVSQSDEIRKALVVLCQMTRHRS